MSTSYDVVFRAALGRIKDFNIPLMDDAVATEDFKILMDSAILNFEYPRVNLKDKDDDLALFNNTLDFDTIQLLGYLVAYEWLNRVVLDIDVIKPGMSPEEFKTWSHGNSLTGLEKMLKFHEKRINNIKRAYSRRDENNISRLGGLAGGGRQ
jgi:hypothetical protein